MAKVWRVLCVAALLVTLAMPALAASAINSGGYFNGIKLCGKVKVVEYNGDIKVQVVEHFPDLKVQIVEHFPSEIGEWQFVEYGQDFTVQFVENFPDITIQYVEHFPGVD